MPALAKQLPDRAALRYPTQPNVLILSRGVTQWSVGERTTVLAHTDLKAIRRHIFHVLELEDVPTLEVNTER